MEKKFCTNCGSPLKEDAAFCVSCGTAVSRPQPEIPESQKPLEQPEQPVVQPAPEPAKPEKKKKSEKKKKKASKTALPICIALFVLVCSVNGFLGVRQATSAKNGEKLAMAMFQQIDLTGIKAANVVAEDDYDGSVADWIVDRAMEESKDKEQFDEEDFANYLEESEMIKTLTQHTGSLIYNIRTGAETEELTTDDVRQMLEDDRAMIKKHLNFEINENDIEKIVFELEKTKALEFTNPGVLRDKAPGLYYTIQYGLSDWILIGLLVLIALCVLALFLATRGKLRSFLGRTGLTVAIAGGASIGGAMLLSSFGDWLFESLGSLNFLGSIVSGAASNFLVPGFGIVALGIAMLCVRSFMKKEDA